MISLIANLENFAFDWIEFDICFIENKSTFMEIWSGSLWRPLFNAGNFEKLILFPFMIEKEY
ncbi:hypothetical protein ACJX0J_010756, partial [Zea mays]